MFREKIWTVRCFSRLEASAKHQLISANSASFFALILIAKQIGSFFWFEGEIYIKEFWIPKVGKICSEALKELWQEV